MKNFLSKPITWGGYFKVAGICAVIGVIICAVQTAYLWRDELTEWAAEKMVLRRFNKAIDEVNKEQGA